MLLMLILILLLIWSAVVGSIYSNFMVFYRSFSETENYNKAYYASIAALERAELVIRQREPWYIWSWGWILGLDQNTDKSPSDKKINDFSYLSSKPSTLFRTINSRATRIPAEWQWNVERLLATWDSINYNKMDYENAENFLLYYDKSEWNSYNKTSCSSNWCQKSALSKIEWKIRLPEKLSPIFEDLNTSSGLVSYNIKNDAIVDRQLKWKYLTRPFTIYSLSDMNQFWTRIQSDSVIRESDINDWFSLFFERNYNPNKDRNSWKNTVISEKEANIKPLQFRSIFQSWRVSQLQLKLALLNLLQSRNNSIYPYLEYYLDFWWKEVSDRYFTINAEWWFWDYQVNLIVQKPTVKESILWNFTVIF